MKVVILAVIALSISACLLSAAGQSPSKRRADARGTGAAANAPAMDREAHRIADRFWTALTKCGKSYFLYSDVRLFEFRDTPHFEFQGEAQKPRVLTRVEKLNGVDPLPVEWAGGTKVSFAVCRMNDAAYGYGQTYWHGWGKWTEQHCEFGTEISRIKGKWNQTALKPLSCNQLAEWGLISAPRSSAIENSSREVNHTRSDGDTRLATYVVLSLRNKSEVTERAIQETISVIRKRLELGGYSAYKVEREPNSTDGIVVKLPPDANPERTKRLITTTARFEVFDVFSNPTDPSSPALYSTELDALQASNSFAESRRVLQVSRSSRGSGTVQWAVARSHEIVASTGWRECHIGHPTVTSCSLNPEASEAIDAWAVNNAGHLIGVVLDNELLATFKVAPGDNLVNVFFEYDSEKGRNLMITSKSGPLPAPLNINTQGTLRTYRK
ncbi:MAG TPA: hypothetical protein VNG71_01915 [Pyrinomonadaceae bacterium]|nr:hypothetical protein [Pyrinomonadaceae bacterium]